MKRKFLSLFLAAVMMLGTVIMSIPASAELNFNDTDGHWATEAIEYVVEEGLMNGVGDGTSFAPNMSLTRGMVVTILYRDNGSPKTEFAGTFLDVSDNAYYTAAAEWAYENGIVNGTGTDEWGEPYFSPDRDITRQELATMFKRYADFKYVDTTKGATDIESFPDASSVADWAKDAVKWSVGVGLITGKGGGGAATLSPTDKAVRAEFATIIKRFKEATFEYRLAYNAPVPKSTFTEIPYAKVENADIYVAVDGSDSNPGTKDKPLATFEAAKAKVRELKKTAKDEIVVAFKAGDYGIIDNVTFTEEDSGTEKVPVTYCAYGDGEVYFTNGLYITEEDFKPLDDSDKALFKDANVDSIKKVDLSKNPAADKITSFTPLSSKDGFCWLARVPNKKNGVDAYYPGFTKHVLLPTSAYKTIPELVAAVNAAITKTNEEVSSHIDHYKLQTSNYLRDTLASIHTLENVQLIGYIGKVWHQDTLNVTGFDKDTGIVHTTGPHYIYYAMIQTQQQAYLNNVSEELDDEGEYFIDPDTKTLYVYKPGDEYLLCYNDTFVTLDLANNITFRKLNFRGSKDNALVIRRCNGFTFDQGTLFFGGGHYGVLSDESINLKITNSEFAYFANEGLHISGPTSQYAVEGYHPDALQSDGLVIDNNSIHDIGLKTIDVDTSGIRLNRSVMGQVTHNEVYNSTRGAVRFDDCIMLDIAYNYFHHCMLNSSDGGVVYNFRAIAYRDNNIRYNLFTDIPSLNSQQYAIYADGTCALNIYGNLFYNAGGVNIVLNGGRDNYVENNVSVAGEGRPVRFLLWNFFTCELDDNGDVIGIVDGSLDAFKNGLNGIPDAESEYYEKWLEKWPILFKYTDDPAKIGERECLYNTVNYFKENKIIGGEFETEKHFKNFGVLENNGSFSLDENPFFVNPAIGDYRIREDSGFHKIPYEKIGRY